MTAYSSAYIVAECTDCGAKVIQPIGVTQKEAAKEAGYFVEPRPLLPRRRDGTRPASELTFVIPDAYWLSANQRLHWAQKAKRTKWLRALGHLNAKAYLKPVDGPVHIAAFIGYPRAGRADPANAAAVKPLIDGLVDAGVLVDDDAAHVIGPTFLRDTTKAERGTHTVRLVLTPQDIPWLDDDMRIEKQ